MGPTAQVANAPGTSCTFAANVNGTTPGGKANTSGTVTSTEGGTGNTASANLTVGYNVLGFFSPLPKDTYKAGATIPVKFALADAAGTRISDADAQAIASSCSAKVRLDSGSPGCATYSPTTDTFQFNLNTPKNLSKGTHTIRLDVFAGASIVSTKSTTTTIKEAVAESALDNPMARRRGPHRARPRLRRRLAVLRDVGRDGAKAVASRPA